VIREPQPLKTMWCCHTFGLKRCTRMSNNAPDSTPPSRNRFHRSSAWDSRDPRQNSALVLGGGGHGLRDGYFLDVIPEYHRLQPALWFGPFDTCF